MPRVEPHIGMEASQRLTSAGNALLDPPKGTIPFPVTMHRVEAGSSFRILETAATAWPPPGHEHITHEYVKADYLGHVTQGLEDLHGPDSPDNEAKQRRTRWLSGDQGTASQPSLLVRRAQTAPDAVGRRGRRRSSVQRQELTASLARLVALSEFTVWCSSRFGGVDGALEVIGGFEAGASVGLDRFASGLAERGYPMGKMNASRLFGFLDTTLDGFISRINVVDATRDVKSNTEVSKEKWEALHQSMDQQLVDNDIDPVEAHFMKSAGSDVGKLSPLQKMQERLMKTLVQEEPLLAEFMQYLFLFFKTLKAAFRQMDVNQSGSLSKSEFKDSLIRLRSKDGKRFLEFHARNIYKKLATEPDGILNMTALLKTVESEDGLVKLFGGFLADALRKANEPPDSPLRSRDLEDAFQKAMGGKRALLTFDEFHACMSRLKYADWLINKLFTRIDADGSGDISVSELTSFLEPDIPRPRPASFMPAPPLGSQTRQLKLLGGQCTTAASSKLGGLGGRKAHIPVPNHPILQTDWHTELNGFAATYNRKQDHLETIRQALGLRRSRRSQSCSTLLSGGEHRLKGSHVPLKDLLPATQQLGLSLYEIEARGGF